MQYIAVLIGLIAVNVLAHVVGWSLLDWQWWLTVVPLFLFICIGTAALIPVGDRQ